MACCKLDICIFLGFEGMRVDWLVGSSGDVATLEVPSADRLDVQAGLPCEEESLLGADAAGTDLGTVHFP